MRHDKEYDSMKEYEFSIMHREDDTDPMDDYEFSIMSHLKDD